jgi:hypothetical protein
MASLFDLPFEEPEADEPAPPRRPEAPYTVSGLTAALRDVIDGAFGVIAVEGEVSNCRTWTTGHVYFTLNDELAQVRAVIFRTTARQLKFTLQDGEHVVVRGRLAGMEEATLEIIRPRGPDRGPKKVAVTIGELPPLGDARFQQGFPPVRRRQ